MKDTRIEYLEKEFNYYYNELIKYSSQIINNSNGEFDHEDDYFSFYEYWTHEYLQRMYNILCVYFESMNLSAFLIEFKERFASVIADKESALKIGTIPFEYGDTSEDLFILIEWKKFLAPFHFFWDKNAKKEEIDKFIQIIKSTNEILKLTKTTVSKEEDINSIIRDILNLYYTEVTPYSEGYFRHSFKDYRPDVIIGEIGVALEYKLIRQNKEIGNKMDELIIDANRYTGNHKNKKCIAVFCLSKKVSKTSKQIKEDWNKMEFPENWSLIIIPDIEIE